MISGSRVAGCFFACALNRFFFKCFGHTARRGGRRGLSSRNGHYFLDLESAPRGHGARARVRPLGRPPGP